jgi:hypothetical protein
MSKFAKGKSWIEHRISSDAEIDGAHYTVNLLGRKGTGVHGFRMSLVFLPHDGTDPIERALANATSTADIHRMTRELADDAERVAGLLRTGESA